MSTLAVLRETRRGENRVALVPAEIPRIAALGLTVVVEQGAGQNAGFADDDYRAQEGTTVAPDREAALRDAGLTVTLNPPATALPENSALLTMLAPSDDPDLVRDLAARRITAFSFNLVPRTSRAQSMDALSSQASLGGYQAALLAADQLGRALPMMMTAAGTIPPAKALVIGAGVAGLQAIATTRRLGASVSAYDVRREAAEEVRSLGATFIELPLEATEGTGGYAAEQSADFLARQQELLADAVARSDIVITTAAVPGRPAPKIVSAANIERMRRGSVVVDMATGSGGNTDLARDSETIFHNGVEIIGASDLPSKVATTASTLYARNVSNFLALVVRDGAVTPNFDDDIVDATCLTHEGVVRHEPTRALLEGSRQ